MIEHGRIVERGTYRQLLARDGPFRRLAAELDRYCSRAMSDFHALLNEQIGHEFAVPWKNSA